MKARLIVKSLVGGVPSLKRERRQHTKVPGNWYAKGTLTAHQHTKGMEAPTHPLFGRPNAYETLAGRPEG